jgi:hypothetical protein
VLLRTAVGVLGLRQEQNKGTKPHYEQDSYMSW